MAYCQMCADKEVEIATLRERAERAEADAKGNAMAYDGAMALLEAADAALAALRAGEGE